MFANCLNQNYMIRNLVYHLIGNSPNYSQHSCYLTSKRKITININLIKSNVNKQYLNCQLLINDVEHNTVKYLQIYADIYFLDYFFFHLFDFVMLSVALIIFSHQAKMVFFQICHLYRQMSNICLSMYDHIANSMESDITKDQLSFCQLNCHYNLNFQNIILSYSCCSCHSYKSFQYQLCKLFQEQLKNINNFQIPLDHLRYFSLFSTRNKFALYFYQQFFIQYQNVMRKTHDHLKKFSKKSKSKIKPKSKSKDKYLQFDQSFLNALLELKNMEVHSKKKHNRCHKNTVSVYIPQPITKRPKSSFERHFHSTKLGNINPLKISIQKAVTEQDNISFTQITPRINEQQQRKQRIQKESFQSIYQYVYKPNYQRSVIMIQRAWRNYQTYKVISKYNNYFKGLTFKNKQEEKRKQSKQQNDLEKTSKPKHKRTPAQVTSQLREFLDSETCTIPLKNKEYAQKSYINKTKPFKDTSPINMFENRTQSQQDQKSKIIKTVSPFQQILSQRQQLKFSKHHSERIKELQQQQHEQKLMMMIQKIQYQLKQNELEETVQKLLKKSQEQQKHFLRKELVNSPCSSQQQSQQEESKSNFSLQWQTPQQKILEARKRLLQQKRQNVIFKLQRQFTSSRITKEQYENKRDYIFAKYEDQLNKIAYSKKKMQKYYQIINNQTLQFYKETILQNQSTKQLIRKTFSAQSVILKCIMKDITLKNFQPPEIRDMETSQIVILKPPAIKNFIENEHISNEIQQSQQMLQRSQKNEQLKQKLPKRNEQKNLLRVFDKMADSQSFSQCSLVDISDNGLIIIEDNEQQRQKKQKIPDIIKQQLLQQIIKEIFLKDKIYERFRPYIETGVQFNKIQDFEIVNFLKDIQQFFPAKSTLKYRLNQKINPSSLQILKIIRNCDYDVEEYELILDQQCFKRYKRIVEKKFDDKIANKITKIKSTSGITNFKLKERLEEKRLIKIQKIKKYTIFERDLFVMYMKAVFNCLNQLLIQAKSFSTFMNSRSSIGPGQLTLAMKQYNKECPISEIPAIIESCTKRINSIIHYKIDIPSHLNRNQMELFQRQIMRQISIQLQQNQHKWVNYMDETLQIWLDLALLLEKQIINELVNDIYILF